MTGIEDEEAGSLLPDPAHWADAERRAAAAFPDKPAVRHGYVVGYLAATRQREGAPSVEDVARVLRDFYWAEHGTASWTGLAERVVALYAPAPDTTTKETP